ncbi:MAG: hypothetical protein IT437_10295 [Phycisphaerales bacterium]|nr:hypothetical protein [Phycisphaerales bacterium]
MRTGLVGIAVLALAAGGAWAQGQPASPLPSGDTAASTGVPQRDTLLKLTRPITVTFTEQRLEDIISFIRDYTGAEIEPLWADDRNTDGLDRDRTVTVTITNGTVLRLIEAVLAKASDGFSDNSWQMSETGEIQIGPKSRLNKFRRVQLYDINDLLMEVPEYAEVPRIDLQSVLQSSQGGSGGQSPFSGDQNQNTQDQKRRERGDKATEIIDILTQTVEPEQWQEGGGTGGSIKYWQGTLIVNAPDYMHRQINGYPYWPSRLTRTGTVQNRRYVSLTTDNGISTIDGFENAEATAVVGGHIVRSGGPGGGG